MHVQIVEDGVALFVVFLFFFPGILNVCRLPLPASVGTHLCNVRSAAVAISALNSFNQKQQYTHKPKGAGADWGNGGKIQAIKKEYSSHAARLLCPSTLMHQCSAFWVHSPLH